ncbi:MAG: DMT family transporter [Lachnospiraceae bacterium]|jgi:drug/metabolite transporter (DMT)-like permease
MEKKNLYIGAAACISSGLFWGGCGVAIQYLINDLGLPSLWVTTFRTLVSGLILMVFFTFRMKKEVAVIWKNKKDAVRLMIFSLIGIAGCYYTYFVTVQYTNAPTATVLQYLSPVFVVLYMSIRNKKFPVMQERIAICLVLLGTFFIATHGNIGSLAISSIGLALGISSAIALAFYGIYPKPLIEKFNPVYVYSWAVFFSGIVMNCLCPIWKIDLSGITLTGWFMLIYTLIFGTMISYPLYLYGVMKIGPSKGSMFSSVEPGATAILAAILLATPLVFLDYVGVVLITVAIMILALPKEGIDNTSQ